MDDRPLPRMPPPPRLTTDDLSSLRRSADVAGRVEAYFAALLQAHGEGRITLDPATIDRVRAELTNAWRMGATSRDVVRWATRWHEERD